MDKDEEWTMLRDDAMYACAIAGFEDSTVEDLKPLAEAELGWMSDSAKVIVSRYEADDEAFAEGEYDHEWKAIRSMARKVLTELYCEEYGLPVEGGDPLDDIASRDLGPLSAAASARFMKSLMDEAEKRKKLESLH